MDIVKISLKKIDEIFEEKYIDGAFYEEYPGEIDYYSIFLDTDDGEIELITGLYWDEIDHTFNAVCTHISQLQEETNY